MLKRSLIAAAFFLAMSNVSAETPSQASIESLFEIMQSQQVVEDALYKVDATLQSSLNQSLKGRPATAHQINIVKEAKDEIGELIRNELSWEKMKPVFVQSYQATFSQEEIDGILAFYQTPAGQALLTKLPTALNASIDLMEDQIKNLSPEINAIREKAIERMKNVTVNPNLEVGRGIVSEKKH